MSICGIRKLCHRVWPEYGQIQWHCSNILISSLPLQWHCSTILISSPSALFKLLQLVQTADWEFFWRDVSGEISQSVEPLIIPHLPTSSLQPPDVLNIQEKVKSQACQPHSSSNVRKIIEIHIWLYMIYALFEEINCYQKETNYLTFWLLNQ